MEEVLGRRSFGAAFRASAVAADFAMLILVLFGRDSTWIVRQDDPSELAIGAMPGWALVNPLRRHHAASWRTPQLCASDGTRSLISAHSMIFRSPPVESARGLEQILLFLRWLRFTTGQSTLGIDVLAVQSIEESEFGDAMDPFPSEDQSWGVLRHIELTAIDVTAISSPVANCSSLAVPVYAEILLDAIQADLSGDHIKATLYAAIAVESMAKTCLREALLVAQEVAPAQFRAEIDPRAVSSQQQIDPVYKALEKRSNHDFRTLLHELPIYVLRKSLLREQPALYDKLTTLRKQRNALAHGGETPREGPAAYALAKAALATAIDAFSWFGARGKYVTIYGHAHTGGTNAPGHEAPGL
jgi:hypothetical protein